MITNQSFETTVVRHVKQAGPFKVHGKDYRLEDVHYESSRDGRRVYVMFRVVPLPPDQDSPPDPWGDVWSASPRQVERGFPETWHRSMSFEVPTPGSSDGDEYARAGEDGLEHHGERFYTYTFRKAESDTFPERFQKFLEENVESPEAIRDEDRRTWSDALDAVLSTRKRQAPAGHRRSIRSP